MLPAATIITRANQIAKGPGFVAQALDLLNAVLSDLCQEHDLALARGLYQFNFNPALTTLFGSGPYPLPLDYLRTSGSSGATGTSRSAFYLYPAPAFPAGQPIFMTPIDLAEFDLYPQLPSQSTPELWATDMGGPLTQRLILATTASLTAGSVTGTVTANTGLANGLAMAGEGVKPGTTITIVGTTITLSQAATGTNTAASVFFGIAPNGYAYPAPLGTWPVSIRYQRQMPPLTNQNQYPWFPSDGYLIEELAGRMMQVTDDSRVTETLRRADGMLRKYLSLADDKTNRAQAVQLDPRSFRPGSAYSRAKNTKTQGW